MSAVRHPLHLLRTFCALSLLVLALAGTRSAEASPEQFISNLAQQAIAVSSQQTPDNQKVEQYRTLLKSSFNVEGIGQFVLGRYWRKATDAEKTEYMRLFEEYIVRSYAKRFSAYQGEQLRVLGSQPGQNGSTIVGSSFQNPGGGEPVRIDWQVYPVGGSYQVVDVIVEGVSMGVTQRSEFASVIRRGGGNVEAIISALKKILSHLQS